MAKTPHNLPLKTKIFSLVIAIIFCIVGSKTIIDYKDILKQKDRLVSEVAKDHAKLLNEIDRVSRENLRIALTIANIQAVKEAVSTRDRERLYEQMKSIHRHVNENSPYALRIHFSVPPAQTLLRVWKPEKFDDDLSGFRHTILDVLENGTPLKGLEAGRSGLVVRGLAPIFGNGANPVGVVELHCNVGEVAKIIAEEYGDQNAIYYIEDVKATLGKANPKKIGRFHEIISPPETLGPMVEAEMLEKGVEKSAVFEMGETLITAWPVKDFKQKKIGVYLRFTDISHISEWLNHSMNRMAILAAIFLVLGSLITYFVVRSIIKPVNRVIRRLNEGANQVASASDQISSASQSMASGASLQAASIEETS
jgi:methyl-accepting chemotaxis protein